FRRCAHGFFSVSETSPPGDLSIYLRYACRAAKASTRRAPLAVGAARHNADDWRHGARRKLREFSMPNKPRAIVLLSGGLDSTTTLALAKQQGFELYAVSFRYGQRHVIEVAAAQRIAAHFGVARHVVVDIDLRVFGGSALTSDVAVPKGRSEA